MGYLDNNGLARFWQGIKTALGNKIDGLEIEDGNIYGLSNGERVVGPVPVGSSVGTLISKTITENGTYTASEDSADGYSTVTVNVESGGLPTVLKGREEPSGSVGNNGNIYLKGAVENPVLPVEYTELYYIESNGTQFINTGVVPDTNTRLLMKCNISELNSFSTPFGVRNSDESQAFLLFARYNKMSTVMYNYSSSDTTLGASIYSEDIEIEMSKDIVRYGTLSASLSGASLQASFPIYLFDLDSNGGSYGPNTRAYMKLYSCKIWESDTLVRDFYPCQRVSDSSVGLYDAVNDQFYENAGSGAFLTGPGLNIITGAYVKSSGSWSNLIDSDMNDITASILTSKTITANGSYNPSDDSADGYSTVTVNVPESTLIEKTITENGTYSSISDNADGYSNVTVSVPNSNDYLITNENRLVFSTLTNDNEYYYSICKNYLPTLYSNNKYQTPTINTNDSGILMSSDDILYQILNGGFDYVEYYGYITEDIISNFNLILLASITTPTDEITLNDSIENYDIIVIQGVWANGYAQSEFNTTLFYCYPKLNTIYYATMKDRHGNSSTGVTFTSYTTATLIGHQQCIIYGIKNVQIDREGIDKYVLANKTITSNGLYVPNDDNIYGYNNVIVNVSAESILIEKTITENGIYNSTDDDADGYFNVIVSVPNTYTEQDEGKVVSSSELVEQTSLTITENGTVNTTTNNEVVVNVPNSYTAEDESKVVSSGELVEQTSLPITENGTFDTTTKNEVVVNVSVVGEEYTYNESMTILGEGGGSDTLMQKTVTANGTYTATDDSVLGYSSVTVNVPEDVLVEKTVTTNGTYDPADDNADGYSSVTVNVSGGSGTILNGTELPDNDVGNDGDLYLLTVDTSGYSEVPEGYAIKKFVSNLYDTTRKNLIDTEIPANTENLRVVLKLKFLDGIAGDSVSSVFGAKWDLAGFFLMVYQGAFRFHSKGVSLDVPYETSETVGKDIYVFEMSESSISINGVTYELPEGSTENTSENLCMFIPSNASSTTSTNFLSTFCEIYNCKVYSSNTLIGDFIPVESANNSVGMYNVVDDTYHEAGSRIVAGTNNGNIIACYGKKNSQWEVVSDLSGEGFSESVEALPDIMDYSVLFKYISVSTASGDRMQRVDRYFTRDTNEPIIMLSGGSNSTGDDNGWGYIGYAAISFTGEPLTGTYTSYGELVSFTQKVTSCGTTYYIQRMSGQYPANTDNGKTYFDCNNYSFQLSTIPKSAGLYVNTNDANNLILDGSNTLVALMEKFIDAFYTKYYAS